MLHLLYMKGIVMPDEERKSLSYEQAAAMLPDGDTIHTYVQGGPLLGADWDRAAILALLRDGNPELAGDFATRMHHGLVAHDATGPVFIETREEESHE